MTVDPSDDDATLRACIVAFAEALADAGPTELAVTRRRDGRAGPVTKRQVFSEAIAAAGDLLRMHRTEATARGDVPGRPPFGTPEFARWLNGPITRACGNGYHQGGELGPLRCEGIVETLGIRSPCECECHHRGGAT